MALELRRSDEGSDPFAASEYVQLACLSQRSVQLGVRVGGRWGSIVVHEGHLWSAALGPHEGMTALSLMLDDSDAPVRCSASHGGPGRRNLPDRPCEHTLLEVARTHDERRHRSDRSEVLPEDPFGSSAEPERGRSTFATPGRIASPPPIPGSVAPVLRIIGACEDRAPSSTPDPEPAPASLRSFEQWLDEGTDALLDKDLCRALRAYEAALALQPRNAMVQANVSRLHELIECRSS